jgi:hypothetical protein
MTGKSTRKSWVARGGAVGLVCAAVAVAWAPCAPSILTAQGPSSGTTVISTMKGDLRRLVSANEVYRSRNGGTYAPSLGALSGFHPSAGVSITFVAVAPGGWSAMAAAGPLPGKSCVIFVGSVQPPKTEAEGLTAPDAVVACDRP